MRPASARHRVQADSRVHDARSRNVVARRAGAVREPRRAHAKIFAMRIAIAQLEPDGRRSRRQRARAFSTRSDAGRRAGARPRRHARAVALRLSARGPAAAPGVSRRLRARARARSRRASHGTDVRRRLSRARATAARHNALAVHPRRPRRRRSIASSACPTTPCSTRSAISTPGTEPCVFDVAGVRVRRHHLRGHLVPGAGAQARDAGARTDRRAQRLAVSHAAAGAAPRAVVTRARARPDCRSSTSIASAARTSSCSTARRSSSTRGGKVAQQLPAWHETLALAEFDGAVPQAGARRRSTPGSSRTCTTALVMGVRDYVDKNRFPGVLLGLSGGIDSALTLAVAVDALGRERVRAVMLPSHVQRRDQPRGCARDGGHPRRALRRDPDRADVRRRFCEALADEFTGLPVDATEENIQARIRGTLLMALSNKFGSIVLTTGNKSEMAVGYATLYGDMAGGFAVLKDISKTLVYRLCALPQQPGPRDSRAHHHARRRRPSCAPTRPTRTAAAVRRARRDPRGLRRART